MDSLQLRVLPLLALLASLLYFFYFQDSPTLFERSDCSLFPYNHYWIISKRIVTPRGVISGAVEVKEEKIVSIVKEEDWHGNLKGGQIIDYGEAVIMPGLIDVHAHLDDPGRTEWEGFPSGTRAAAAGGITTLIDMPLNNFPSTVSAETLKLKQAKSNGDSVTVETCPHYLAFSAEEIKDGDTRFKCAPPIRDAANKERLWTALLEGDIDMLSSDHSPSAPDLKLFDEGNFLKAWGGISSLQFVLPVTWSHGRNYGVTLEQLALWWSERPAKLAGQDLKGAIAVGNHADITVWEPNVEFELNNDLPVYLKHPSISAYMGSKLSGKVMSTFVRGNLVYKEGKHAPAACGAPILAT